MSEQTLKFDEIVVNKKDFHASKEPIALNLVVVYEKFKQSEDGFEHFIGYSHADDVIRPLCIILSPMSRYIKYFDNGRKSMSFFIKDENVYLKYTKIWNRIKKLSSVKFHSQPIHDDKYIKLK